MLSHANLLANTRAISSAFEVGRDTKASSGSRPATTWGSSAASSRRSTAAFRTSSLRPRCSSRIPSSGSTRSAGPARPFPADPTSPTTCACARSRAEQRAVARPLLLVRRVHRRRGRRAGHARPLRRGLRAVRIPARVLLSVLRPGGGDADGHRTQGGKRRHGARIPRRRARAERRRAAARRMRPARGSLVGCGAPVGALRVAIVDARDRRARGVRPHRRDLGRRRIRRQGLLAQTRQRPRRRFMRA